jgi:hypothetical protein
MRPRRAVDRGGNRVDGRGSRRAPVEGRSRRWRDCPPFKFDAVSHCDLCFSRVPPSASPTRTAPHRTTHAASNRALACPSHTTVLISPFPLRLTRSLHTSSPPRKARGRSKRTRLGRWRRRRRSRRSCNRTPSRTSCRRSRTAFPVLRRGVRHPPPPAFSFLLLSPPRRWAHWVPGMGSSLNVGWISPRN